MSYKSLCIDIQYIILSYLNINDCIKIKELLFINIIYRYIDYIILTSIFNNSKIQLTYKTHHCNPHYYNIFKFNVNERILSYILNEKKICLIFNNVRENDRKIIYGEINSHKILDCINDYINLLSYNNKIYYDVFNILGNEYNISVKYYKYITIIFTNISLYN